LKRHPLVLIFFISCLCWHLFSREDDLKFLGSVPKEHHNVFFRTIPFITIDNQGVIYASDNRDNVIYKIDVTGDTVKTIGRPGQGPGDLNHPWLVYVESDDLFVADDVAISTFKITGEYVNRFRIYNKLITFTVNKESIFTVESGTEELITRYDRNGKRLSSFGLKYSPKKSIYEGWPTSFIDSTLNEGKILIGNNAIYFISFFFAELYKYDLAGQLVTQNALAEEDVIKKNKELYLNIGQPHLAGMGFKTFRIIKDAYYFNGKIFILMGNTNSEKRAYEEIVKIDENDMSKRTRLPLTNIHVTPSSWGGRSIACGINKWMPVIFVSLYDDKEAKFLINMYREVKR
jgi:hypothetical protein